MLSLHEFQKMICIISGNCPPEEYEPFETEQSKESERSMESDMSHSHEHYHDHRHESDRHEHSRYDESHSSAKESNMEDCHTDPYG